MNDIDLEIVDPSGNVLYPNGQSMPDRVNNAETIDVLQPKEGRYIVRIRGTTIPNGKNGMQPYALVVSGI
ncbi:MAG: PPC domain-containing protein [Deltaproteobacteria bacterium]|nr:PPC domain-containing protein [Deltaproteobacteria bacterium]